MEVGDGCRGMLALDGATQDLHDARGEALADACEQRSVVAEANGLGSGEGQHPLAKRHRWQAMVDQQSGALAHAPAGARRTDAAGLA
jgi:hypothetical protein